MKRKIVFLQLVISRFLQCFSLILRGLQNLRRFVTHHHAKHENEVKQNYQTSFQSLFTTKERFRSLPHKNQTCNNIYNYKLKQKSNTFTWQISSVFSVLNMRGFGFWSCRCTSSTALSLSSFNGVLYLMKQKIIHQCLILFWDLWKKKRVRIKSCFLEGLGEPGVKGGRRLTEWEWDSQWTLRNILQ